MEFCPEPGKDEAPLFKWCQCQTELLVANENAVQDLSAQVDPGLTLKAVTEGEIYTSGFLEKQLETISGFAICFEVTHL